MMRLVMRMTDNETFGVLSILGVIVIIGSVIMAIDTALIIHLIWLIGQKSMYMSPMAMLIIGFNLLTLCGMMYAMGVGD